MVEVVNVLVDVLELLLVDAVVTVVLVVVAVTGTQLPSGVQTASVTKAPPRLLHATASSPSPSAQEPSNWQQPPGEGGPVLQRPPPPGSAWQVDSLGPGVPPAARQAPALSADPQTGGCTPRSSQHTEPGGLVVLVVEVVEVIVVTVVTVMSVVLVVVLVIGMQLPPGSQTASATNAPPRLLHISSFSAPPMAHPLSN